MQQTPQTIYDNSSKVRRRTMFWMTRAEFKWWFILTDPVASITPKFCWKFRFFLCKYMMAFGFSMIANKHTGPPSD